MRREWPKGRCIEIEFIGVMSEMYFKSYQGNWCPIVADLLADDWEKVKNK